MLKAPRDAPLPVECQRYLEKHEKGLLDEREEEGEEEEEAEEEEEEVGAAASILKVKMVSS